MHIYVDADACPVIDIVEKIASKHMIGVTLVCDTNHILESKYSDIVVVAAGRDSVDFKIIGMCDKNDVIVTQDYGVAAMALGKGAAPIHQSGKWYTDDNIDLMLMERHVAKKKRRTCSRIHIKGQKKRTEEDDKLFEESLERLIRKKEMM